MRAHFNPILYLCYLIFAMALFPGCAARGPVLIQNSEKDFTALKNSRVGVAFFAPDKRVLFTEQIYLVFGYSEKVSYHAYEGIWDPIPVLQDKVSGELNAKYQITPIRLNEIMRPEAFSAMSQFCENNYKQNRNRIKGVVHPDDFMKERLPVNILDELKAINIEYFLEVYLAAITYYDPAHWDWILCGVGTYSRLNRVSDGSIVWLNNSGGSFILKNLTSLTELEKNDMALLKQGYNEAVSRGEVLKGFAPQ